MSSAGHRAGVRVLAVDWSGDARSASRRIRLAEAAPGRLLAVWGGLDREGVADLVTALADEGPVVVGIDFSFALPAWFAREHGCRDVDELWALVARDGEDWLRHCPPPFWGRAGTRRPLDDPARPLRRRTELASPHRPLSTFQVGGAGAVGTGSLRGMPLLARLRAGGIAVWPFDDAGTATVLEIYPREMTGAVVKSDAAARRDRVAGDGRVPAELRGAAAASEDAFDAAFAALELAEHVQEIAGLRRGAGDDLLEGRIWRPGTG